jgi:adenine-specific DNA-methyltransferase
LLGALQSRFILVSYSTDGLIPLQSLVELACHRGHTRAVTRRYKRYRVSSQRYSPRSFNVEFVLVIDGQSGPDVSRAAGLVAEIRRSERANEQDEL